MDPGQKDKDLSSIETTSLDRRDLIQRGLINTQEFGDPSSFNFIHSPNPMHLPLQSAHSNTALYGDRYSPLPSTLSSPMPMSHHTMLFMGQSPLPHGYYFASSPVPRLQSTTSQNTSHVDFEMESNEVKDEKQSKRTSVKTKPNISSLQHQAIKNAVKKLESPLTPIKPLSEVRELQIQHEIPASVHLTDYSPMPFYHSNPYPAGYLSSQAFASPIPKIHLSEVPTNEKTIESEQPKFSKKMKKKTKVSGLKRKRRSVGSNLPKTPNERVYVMSACMPCFQSKIRCNDERPCSNCIKKDRVSKCIDRPHKTRGRPSKKYSLKLSDQKAE